MSFSLPKGRNYSKENINEKKYYGTRHSEKASFFSLLSNSNVLQEKSNLRLNKYIYFLMQSAIKWRLNHQKKCKPDRPEATGQHLWPGD
jgi:hypothetical protein